MASFGNFLASIINKMCQPSILFTVSVIVFFLVLFPLREKFAEKKTLYWMEGLMLLFILVSCLNPTFKSVVTKPDNIPIVGMLFLLLFFTWLAFHKMVRNDRLIDEGKDVENKKEAKELVFTWPDLVFSEFICSIIAWCVLVIWSIVLKAPLEEPANPVETPNPSKAPWYFLGLQEMLVYYDPWLAGVVFPTLIVVGLILIPFIDINPKGNGYYTFKERKLAVTSFLFGFLILWVLLIIYGTFLRGPNWNFFGPYEIWDLHKLEVLKNVNLSEYLFRSTGLNGGKLPDNPFIREGLGMLLVIGYFVYGIILLQKKWMKELYEKMGGPRFYILAGLILSMGALPIKMVLRWTINLKYIVAIPEWFFNI
ncbi:MAG: cytochrome C [Proteobacteria bacterium]|nr:cytochrome C [Pseudomonadota bacterium]